MALKQEPSCFGWKTEREKWADRKFWWDAHGGIWISIMLALATLCGFFGVKSCNSKPEATVQQKKANQN